MSLKALKILINTLHDRMESVPVCSARFKAGLIVNRRLTRNLKDYLMAMKQLTV